MQRGERQLVERRARRGRRRASRRTASCSAAGTTSQPSRSAGASVLLTEPSVTTRSGASPCSAPPAAGRSGTRRRSRPRRRARPRGAPTSTSACRRVRRQHDSGRELVRRGDHHDRRRRARRAPPTSSPSLVDRDRHHDRPACSRRARCPGCTGPPARPRSPRSRAAAGPRSRTPGRHPRHHHVIGGQPGGPDAAQVARRASAAAGPPGRVAVAQVGVGHAASRALVRPAPGRPRERRRAGVRRRSGRCSTSTRSPGRTGAMPLRRWPAPVATTVPDRAARPVDPRRSAARTRRPPRPGRGAARPPGAGSTAGGRRGEPAGRHRLAERDHELVAEPDPGPVELDEGFQVVSSNRRQVDLPGGPREP